MHYTASQQSVIKCVCPVEYDRVTLLKFGIASPLALQALITTAADDIHKYFFIVFSEKIRL